MVYRKGEFQLSTLDRIYPFHVAILLPSSEAPHRQRYVFVGELQAFYQAMNEAPRQTSIGGGETEHVIYGFQTEEAAKIFQSRFGGFRIGPTHKARQQAEERLRAEKHLERPLNGHLRRAATDHS